MREEGEHNNMLKEKYELNTPIFEEDLSDGEMVELQADLESGVAKEFGHGTYYYPVKRPTRGDSLLNPQPVIERRFLSGANGFYSGLTLLNIARVSTQIPNRVELTSNNATDDDYFVKVGVSRVKVQKPPTTIVEENIRALQFLDLLHLADYVGIDRYEREGIMYFKDKLNVDVEDLIPYLSFYPNAINSLKEVGLV